MWESELNPHTKGAVVDEFMQTGAKDVYAAGDVTGLSGIWPNAMKQGQMLRSICVGIQAEYTDRYAMKNTMNFYGLVTLSLGRGVAEEGDIVLEEEDAHNYRRASSEMESLTASYYREKLTIPVFISI